jgi:hypothetical protein
MKLRARIKLRARLTSENGKNGHKSRKKEQMIKNKTETPAHFHQRIS